MAYQGSKFSSRMVEDIFPTYYTNRSECEKIVNTMLRYFLCKKYKEDIVKEDKNILEQECGFYETTIYRASDVTNVIHTLDQKHQEVLCVIHNEDDNNIKNIIDTIGGFIELNTPDCPINQFMLTQTKRPTNVFVNKEKHYVVVFTHNEPIESWYIQLFSCAIKIWSWLFENVSDAEMQMFKALNKKDLEKFTLIINQFFPDDIFDALKMQQLQEYSKVGIKNKIRTIQKSVSDLDSRIYNAHISLNRDLETRMDKLLELEGLELSLAKNDNNMCDFFANRHNIQIIKINTRSGYSPQLFYVIKETLEFYDTDEFKRSLSNKSSYLYRSEYDEWIRTLFVAIFVEERGKFCVQSEFSLEGLAYIQPYNHHSLEDVRYDEYMPHPHLGFHQCLGGNKSQIDNYLCSGDWDLAIDQTIAATKNLNFGDTTVMSSMIRYISEHTDEKYILADNGEKMSVEEFLKYLDNQKAGDNNE